MKKTNKPFKFEWEYDDFCVRTSHRVNGTPYVELLKYCDDSNGKRCAYTIAYWYRGNDGWDLRFVGDRMLELSQLHIEKVWAQLCAAQIMLQKWYEDQEEEW